MYTTFGMKRPIPRNPYDESPGCQNNVVVKIKDIDVNHSYRKCQTRYLVRGRIKPQPKIYENAKKNGKHLRAVLFDKTSKITLVAHNDHCDKFLDKLQTLRIITLGNFEVKKNKPPYEIPDHGFTIYFIQNSVIEIIDDDQLKMAELNDFPIDNFTKGNDIPRLIPQSTFDVVGQIFEDGRCKKIVVDFQEFTVFFSEPIDDIQNGTALRIYNATIKNVRSNEPIIHVGKYSFSYVIPNDEYLQFLTTTRDQSINTDNGQQLLPNHSVVAANSPGTLLAQGPSTSRSSQLNIGSPKSQIIQSSQTLSASYPSSSSPTIWFSQNPQSTPVPSSSSPNKQSAQMPSTSQLNKRHMQSFDDDETVPKVFKKTDGEVSLMSNENFMKIVEGRLAVCSEVDKQRIQLKVLNLIEDEIKEITQYDHFTQDK